jgi:hypothetical protein
MVAVAVVLHMQRQRLVPLLWLLLPYKCNKHLHHECPWKVRQHGAGPNQGKIVDKVAC